MAANTDKWRKKTSRFSTTLNGSISDSDTSLVLHSVTDLPTDTAVTIIVNRVDSDGVATPSAMEVMTGVISGFSLGSLLRGEDSTTARSHEDGSIVEIVFEADGWNDAVDSFLAEHSQSGSHSDSAISTPTHAATEKTDPVDDDEVPLVDSEDSFALKKITFASILSAVGAYIASVALSLTNKTLEHPTVNAPVAGYDSHTPSASGTATLDLSSATRHSVAFPAGNITIALSNATAGQYFQVELTQDATGSRTVSWFSTIRWAGGSAPTLTTTANKRDVFGFICTGAGTYDGYIIGMNI